LDQEVDIHGKWIFGEYIVLEERQKEIQLLSRATSIEADTASIQDCANQTDTEVVVRQVERIDLPGCWRAAFVAKCHNAVQSIKYDSRVYHLVVVKLPEVFSFRNPALIELEVVLFETERDLFKHIVDDANNKVLVVPIEPCKKDSKQMYIAELDFARFAEDLLKDRYDLDGH
jgi:hypothetical protein